MLWLLEKKKKINTTLTACQRRLFLTVIVSPGQPSNSYVTRQSLYLPFDDDLRSKRACWFLLALFIRTYVSFEFFIHSFFKRCLHNGTCNLLERKTTTVTSTAKINRSIKPKKYFARAAHFLCRCCWTTKTWNFLFTQVLFSKCRIRSFFFYYIFYTDVELWRKS